MLGKSRGFTVIELMIVVTVVAIILALALPSYSEIINRRAVTNASEQLAVFMNLARSESVKRNRAITVEVDDASAEFCAGMWDATDCDCLETDASSANYCKITQGGQDTHLVIRGRDFENLQSPVLTTGGAGDTNLKFTFDPVRGVLDTTNDASGEILMTSRNDNFALRIEVALSGRVEICSPAGKTVPGYQTCTP